MEQRHLAVWLVQLTDFPEAGRVDIYEYARALAEQGVSTHVIICRKSRVDVLPPRLVVHELNLSTSNDPLNTLRFVYRAYQVIRSLQQRDGPSLVHLFNPAPATFLLGLLLRLSPRRPHLVYDIRTGGLGFSPDALAINAMAKLSRFLADGVIVLSRALGERLFPNRPPHLTVVPLGVNTESFQPVRQSPRKEFHYLYTGTLNKNRRLHYMLEAFALVHQRYPQTRLIIAGDGNDRPHLEAWVRHHKFSQAVTFLRRVNYTDVPKLLRESDCGLAYVPITSWFHPQPQLKTLEYLATNLPVVATATDGNAELWRDLPKPLLTGDKPEEFARGMEYAFEKYEEIAKNDVRRIALAHDWRTIVRQRLIPFYQRVLT